MSDPVDFRDNRGVGTLISDLIQQVSSLMQTEIRLLRSEMGDKLKTMLSGAVEVLAGGLLLMAALLILLQALVVALAHWVGAGWASLIVGVVVAVIGAILVKRGTSNIEPSNLTPDQTTNQLARDAAVVKEQFK
jgi:uncharacterized membrane protein YqjE